MKITLLFLTSLIFSGGLFGQPLAWDEVGSDPAYCRLFSYQNGGGVVWASVTGGVAPIDFEWTNLTTGATTPNAIWGGRNPGLYQITVTDNVGATLTQVIELDSVRPIASFDEISGNVMPIADGWVGFTYEYVIFSNQSENFANPHDPVADTTFFWNLDYDTQAWQISHDVNEQFNTGYGSGTHQVCLVTLNKKGCADTLCKQIHIFGPAGLEDEVGETKFVTIYSEHQQNILYVNCAGFSEQIMVEIFSVSGQKVASFETSTGITETPFKAVSGIYLYTIKGQSSQEVLATGKLIHK